MDAQRFGRALGVGARAAGKALVQAADAAAAPNPRGPAPNPSTASAPAVLQARIVSHTAAVRRGGKAFGQTVWEPAAKAGGVLWYEVTGFFFGLFSAAAALEVWKRRADFLNGGGRVWLAVAMALGFGWFTVSSFTKARRRQRR